MDGVTEIDKGNGSSRLDETYGQAVAAVKKANDRAQSFIRERPAVALLGALALGFAVARIARHFEK